MKKPSANISYWFCVTGILCLVIFLIWSLTAGTDASIDIAIHDTYYVVAVFHAGFIIFIFYEFFALLYFIAEKFNLLFSKKLSFLHYIIATLFFTYFLFYAITGTDTSQMTYYDETSAFADFFYGSLSHSSQLTFFSPFIYALH